MGHRCCEAAFHVLVRLQFKSVRAACTDMGKNCQRPRVNGVAGGERRREEQVVGSRLSCLTSNYGVRSPVFAGKRKKPGMHRGIPVPQRPSAPREQGRWLREERRERRGSKCGGGQALLPHHQIRSSGQGVCSRVQNTAQKEGWGWQEPPALAKNAVQEDADPSRFVG